MTLLNSHIRHVEYWVLRWPLANTISSTSDNALSSFASILSFLFKSLYKSQRSYVAMKECFWGTGISKKLEMLWHPFHNYWIKNVITWTFCTDMIFLATFNFILPLLPKIHHQSNSMRNTDCCHLPNNLKFLKISKDATTWILKLLLIQWTNKVYGEGIKVNFSRLEDIKTVERCWIRSVNHTLPWRLLWS